MNAKPLHVMMLGLRGFPQVQGGVESHVENLSQELTALGCRITAVVRSRYQQKEARTAWNGIAVRGIWAPQSSYLEAVVHTFLGILYAATVRPDILHIHAIGPALMTPLARTLGLRVVVTHHGEDYNRQKWGKTARCFLKLGEHVGMRYAHKRIVISKGILASVTKKFGIRCEEISNGVKLPELTGQSRMLDKFGIASRRYVLLVSRFVPEKRHTDLIHAFLAAKMPGWKLALVGKADHLNAYSTLVQNAASRSGDIVCTGFLSGQELHEIYLHAGIFVLPSSHEGLPISILEAMSYGLPVIASDIQANRELAGIATDFFPMGNIEALTRLLEEKADYQFESALCEQIRDVIRTKYNWRDIAQKTFTVYQAAQGAPRRLSSASVPS
jgi:glycosyltransferase involved in cell wall biosynthesis